MKTKQNQKVWVPLYVDYRDPNGGSFFESAVTNVLKSHCYGVFSQHYYSEYRAGDPVVLVGKDDNDFIAAFVGEYIGPATLEEGVKTWGRSPHKSQTPNGKPTQHKMRVLSPVTTFRMKLKGVQKGTIAARDRPKLYATIANNSNTQVRNVMASMGLIAKERSNNQ